MPPYDEQSELDRFLLSFTNITPTAEQIQHIERLRTNYKDTLACIFSIVPRGRERSLALTNLETSLMYAVKAILMP